MIPGAAQSFRSTRGSLDRPFARPGDWVTLSLDPDCHLRSGFPAALVNNIVTIVFTPPAGGLRNVITLATSCAGIDVNSCRSRPDVDSARCLTVNNSFDPVSLVLLDPHTLRFRFPDSDAFLLPAADGRGFTGPATIAVTSRGEPLPCDLAALTCAQRNDLVACADRLFDGNGSCDASPHSLFPHFTALPHANSYESLCTHPVPPCTGQAVEIRATIDAAGNALIPMDWRGVLVNSNTLPVARLLRSATDVEAFEGRGVPVRIPSLDVLSSFSPTGAALPPLFDPQRDPTQSNLLTLFGSADAPETVLRITRHRAPMQQCSDGINVALPCLHDGDCPGAICVAPSCVGGSNAGSPCTADADCPDGECGPGLFDFSTRLFASSGPVVIRRGACIGGSNAMEPCTDGSDCPGGYCTSFSFVALDPVSLDGLTQSDSVNAFVMEETARTPPVDLNGDGDTLDSVVKLGNRFTGTTQPIGVNGSEARAIVRIRQPPFSFPALAAADDVIAFLEPELYQGNADTNGNGNIFDTILRVFRLDTGELTQPGLPISADAAPVIGGRSLAASNGRVFFRASEAAAAAQITSVESVNSAGELAQGGRENKSSTLSADGRYVAFHSGSPNLTPYPNPVIPDYVFVRDRIAGTTTLISKKHNGQQSNGGSFWPTISASGRFVAFQSSACDLIAGDCYDPQVGGTYGDINNALDVFVHDRDFDGNGVFDEAGGVKTVLVSVASNGSQGNANSGAFRNPISASGRFVPFESRASNLVPDDTNDFCGSSGTENCSDVFVHDRDVDEDGIFDEPGAIFTVRVSVDSNGVQGNGASTAPHISGDGRFVAFESSANNLVSGDTNNTYDVFLHDRDTDEDGIFDEPGAISTVRVSVDSNGSEGNNWSRNPHIAANGCCVAFSSLANNLVAGDTNSFSDAFVREIQSRTTTLISRTPQGVAANSNSGVVSISADGRLIAFASHANNLGPTPGPVMSNYIYDRLTGQIQMNHRNSAAQIANSTITSHSTLSSDGHYVTFGSGATNLTPGDDNNLDDIFVRGPDPATGDISGDGDSSDMILQVLDATAAPPAPWSSLCPADLVAILDGNAAFLRPEAAGETTDLPLCPAAAALVGDKPDLNGDGDAQDSVVHLWTGGTVQNLGRAATQVELSSDWVAALVPEAAEGATDFNADADLRDQVVQLHPVSGGGWTNVGQAADRLAVSGNVVAFLTPEKAQGATDLNGDSDSQDRVLQVFDTNTAWLTNVGQAAEDMVLGNTGLVAFRTREAAQGSHDLNDDGDTLDDVLQIYDPSSYTLIRSGMAVTPCRLEACDPRLPYRVLDDTVTYLTLEADQGVDLNDDGDMGDLVLQVLNVRQTLANSSLAGAVSSLASVSAGLCTGTGEACAADDTCSSGRCFVPPGGCLRNLGTPCDPAANPGTINNPCVSPQQFCQPILGAPNHGVCFRNDGACQTNADCVAGAYCSEGQQAFQRLMNPLAPQEHGAVVFTGSGRCVESSTRSCTLSSQCRFGEYCSRGKCRREHGVCAKNADCPTDAACEPVLLRSTAADRDGDEIPDAIDNCPDTPNILQEDSDEDGVGDACDTAECANGLLEPSEPCDDGNRIDGDGCDRNCTLTACGNRIVTAGEECDDGNPYEGDGCDSNCTLSACGNGIVAPGEECDDGNQSNDDPCKADCTYHRCGDGYLNPLMEVCDDGNLIGGDGCESDCQITVPRDVMVEPIGPVNITMKKGHETTIQRFRVTARNADLPGGPTGAFPVRLAATTDCPHLYLLPMLFTPGRQESIVLAPGAAAKATTELQLYFSMTSLNRRSPFRCTITFTASSVPPYPDPMPSNNSVTVDVNVVDLHDPDQETSTESVMSSVKFLRVIVPRGATAVSRNAPVSVVNADIRPFKADPGHEISVSASDGTCPPGTVGMVDFDPKTPGVQDGVTVKGGQAKRGKLSLTIDPAAFTSGNAKSPHRCVAMLTATDAAPDAETTNDTTRLVIDVYDKNDF